MGNNLGAKAKVMRTNGETIQYRTPIQAWEIMKDYYGHVLLESVAVKRLGLRATPLGPQEMLMPNNLYFLVETSLFSKRKVTIRAYSDVNTSAKDRLERLKLHRRLMSDLLFRQIDLRFDGPNRSQRREPSSDPVQVKVKLPKPQLAKLVKESRDEGEVANKIFELIW